MSAWSSGHCGACALIEYAKQIDRRSGTIGPGQIALANIPETIVPGLETYRTCGKSRLLKKLFPTLPYFFTKISESQFILHPDYRPLQCCVQLNIMKLKCNVLGTVESYILRDSSIRRHEPIQRKPYRKN